MRRLILLSLVIGAVALVLGVSYLYAQGDQQAEYVGTLKCASCHRELGRLHATSRHALALQDTRRDKEAILAQFDQGEDVRTVQFPGEDAPRPFTADDVAFTIGSGRYVQRYLYAVKRNEYAVFPAEWNIAAQQWQPYSLADNWPDAAYDWTQNCAYCHVTALNVTRGKWEDEGVQCEACHGPGSIHADLAEKVSDTSTDDDLSAVRGAIVLSPDPEVCGQCHSRGNAPDGHPYPVDYVPGQELLNESTYTLVSPDDAAYWWPTGHGKQAYMQFNEWLTAGHSNALNALKGSDKAKDACLQCHSTDYRWTQALIEESISGERPGSPPEQVTLDTAQHGVTCVSCHTVHLKPENLTTGNNPALLLAQDPYALCVQCHHDNAVTEGLHHPMQEMYEGQTVVNEVPGIPSAHFSAERGPNCVTCHTPLVPVETVTRASHVFRPVMPGAAMNVEGLQSTCAACHGAQVENAGLQKLIDDIQSDTRARLDRARVAVTPSTPAWVSTALDFIEGDRSLGVHNYAYTDQLLDAVEAEFGLAAPPEGQVAPAAQATEATGTQ